MPQSVLTSCLHLDDMTQPLYARLGTRETTHQASPALKGSLVSGSRLLQKQRGTLHVTGMAE